VRWALELKKPGVKIEYVPVDLLTDEAESQAHHSRNPLEYVPVLELVGQSGPFLGESMAIIEWLDETYPTPPLLPEDPWARAHARQLAELINAGIQPLQNLTTQIKVSKDHEERKLWAQFWIKRGLLAYETLIRDTAGNFSVGNEVSLPDLFLIPQCYAALRNEVSLSEFPRIEKIYTHALETPEVKASHPDRFKPPTP
jgi:maleylpyruvate isomerase